MVSVWCGVAAVYGGWGVEEVCGVVPVEMWCLEEGQL